MVAIVYVIVSVLLIVGLVYCINKGYYRSFLFLVITTCIVVLLGVSYFNDKTNLDSFVREGEVIGLKYLEAETKTYRSTSSVRSGEAVISVPRSRTVNYPESWAIDVKGSDGKESTYYVGEDTFNSLKIGDSIKYNEDTMDSSRPES